MEKTISVRKSVTIERPVGEVFRFWRNFENFPRFMAHIESVRAVGPDRSHWKAKVAGKAVEWDAEIAGIRENESIGWRSVPGSSLDIEGQVRFREAPGGRGTVVTADFSYRPPGGAAGSAAARAADIVTAQQVKEDMRRFKQILEAGEIPTTKGQPTGKAARKAA